MNLKENQPNYSFNTPNSANFYLYRNPSLHHNFVLNHLYRSTRNLKNNRIYSEQSPARLRILQSVQSTDKLDIYLDGIPFAKHISYKEENQYLYISPGKHQITLYSSNNKRQPFLKKKISLDPNKYYTLITTADRQHTGMIAFEDQPLVPAGESKIRFLNLTTVANEIDIAVKNRDVIFSNIHYGNCSNYLGITPMNIELEVRKAGTTEVLLNLPILRFEPNTAYSILILEDDILLLPENP